MRQPSERDITPDPGMEVPGGYVKEHFKAIHDPCKVRAAVFDDGNIRVALVGLDALIVPRYVVLVARKAIHQQGGIPPESILIGASHNYSAGPIAMVRPGQFDGASALVRHLAYDVSSDANAACVQCVQQEIVTAVCPAHSCRVGARCGFGFGKEDKVSFNRRLRMKNGVTYSHPGQGNLDIIGYAGPIDPQVGVIGAWDNDGRPLGCIVNFACHAATNPPGFSANWIYHMEKPFAACWIVTCPWSSSRAAGAISPRSITSVRINFPPTGGAVFPSGVVPDLPVTLQNPAVVALRTRTKNMGKLYDATGALAAARRWLVPHAKSGIGALAKGLLARAEHVPELRICLPHLGWPTEDKLEDTEWDAAVADLRYVPGIVVGISVMAHFSRKPFPHAGIEPFAARLLELLAPPRRW